MTPIMWAGYFLPFGKTAVGTADRDPRDDEPLVASARKQVIVSREGHKNNPEINPNFAGENIWVV